MSRRTELVRFRVTPEEKAAIVKRAGSTQISSYVRETLLGASADSSAPTSTSPGHSAGGGDAEADGQGRAAPADLDREEWVRTRIVQLSLAGKVADARKIANEEWEKKHG